MMQWDIYVLQLAYWLIVAISLLFLKIGERAPQLSNNIFYLGKYNKHTPASPDVTCSRFCPRTCSKLLSFSLKK